jgi:hypothetical protein
LYLLPSALRTHHQEECYFPLIRWEQIHEG